MDGGCVKCRLTAMIYGELHSDLYYATCRLPLSVSAREHTTQQEAGSPAGFM